MHEYEISELLTLVANSSSSGEEVGTNIATNETTNDPKNAKYITYNHY